MLTSILIILCLFHCHHHVNASTISYIEQEEKQLGIRMSLLNVSQYKYFMFRF
jgi:hypothetical protein